MYVAYIWFGFSSAYKFFFSLWYSVSFFFSFAFHFISFMIEKSGVDTKRVANDPQPKKTKLQQEKITYHFSAYMMLVEMYHVVRSLIFFPFSFCFRRITFEWKAIAIHLKRLNSFFYIFEYFFLEKICSKDFKRCQSVDDMISAFQRPNA